jgi:hypothetical protein
MNMHTHWCVKSGLNRVCIYIHVYNFASVKSILIYIWCILGHPLHAAIFGYVFCEINVKLHTGTFLFKFLAVAMAARKKPENLGVWLHCKCVAWKLDGNGPLDEDTVLTSRKPYAGSCTNKCLLAFLCRSHR